MHVAVLILDRCTPIAPIGALELLRKAGEIHQQRTGAAECFFDTELVAGGAHEVGGPNGAVFRCRRRLDEVEATDLLVLPAIEFDVEDRLAANRGVIDQIKRLHGGGAEVASMCTGAFLLAATGLLDGKEATTHWAMAARFRQMYPAVRLRDERIIVDNGGLYTGGGATSFMNLMLYLVEKFCGKETAVLASKMLLIDYKKPGQHAYAMFLPQMQHGDAAIERAQSMLHEQPERPHSVTELARAAHLSLRSFIRRFKAATGEPPASYIQRARVQRAKELLETTPLNVDEVARLVGYNDVPSFRRIFVRHAGLSPRAYRDKYRVSDAA